MAFPFNYKGKIKYDSNLLQGIEWFQSEFLRRVKQRFEKAEANILVHGNEISFSTTANAFPYWFNKGCSGRLPMFRKACFFLTLAVYRMFDFTLGSNILLPELVPSPSSNSRISFSLSAIPSSQYQEPRWLHHWLLPSGETSISLGKSGELFVLRFPLLADFLFSRKDFEIICHPTSDTPAETIRHLLLDQVIPRIVSHLGRPVLHASGSMVEGSGVLFLRSNRLGQVDTLWPFSPERFSPAERRCDIARKNRR